MLIQTSLSLKDFFSRYKHSTFGKLCLMYKSARSQILTKSPRFVWAYLNAEDCPISKIVSN